MVSEERKLPRDMVLIASCDLDSESSRSLSSVSVLEFAERMTSILGLWCLK